jgi:hypothetical protein
MLGVMAAAALLWAPLASAENSSPQHMAMNHQLPAWAEQLKGQTIMEDTIEGRAERAAMVEQQHQRIMDHMQHDPQLQGVNTGMFNTQSMMHQYGAGGQDGLLVSDPRVEPVSITGGGKCPATAPVKQYNVSAINVEITLNQWLDFYPGYMYVLDENLDKVRAEETKNREARDKEGFDPGAVIPGVQAQWIQPLTIRGNQGDCVKIKLANKLEGGEDVSLHIHGSSMVVSATGDDHESGHDRGAGQERRLRMVHPPEHAGRRAAVPHVQQRPGIDGDGPLRVLRRGAARVYLLGAARHRRSHAGHQRLAGHDQERDRPRLPRVRPLLP